MPNTHRRRDLTRHLRRVGIGGVYWALDDEADFHKPITTG